MIQKRHSLLRPKGRRIFLEALTVLAEARIPATITLGRNGQAYIDTEHVPEHHLPRGVLGSTKPTAQGSTIETTSTVSRGFVG